ncbi:MAG: ABC transporter ATP-binding protein [Gemmatimonadota bacterium]
MSDLAIYRWIGRQVRPYWVPFAVFTVLGVLSGPLALLNPVPLKIAVDSVLGSQPLPPLLEAVLPSVFTASQDGILIFAVVLLVAVALAGQLRQLAYAYLKTYLGERLTLDLRAQLFNRAQRLSLGYHGATGTADTVYRIQRDTVAVRYLTTEGAIPFLSALVTVVAMIYVTVRIDWQLALVALGVAPVLVVLTGTVRKRIRGQWRVIKRLESGVQAVVQESLGALLVVKAFGQEDRETERFVGRAEGAAGARLRLTLVEGWFGVFAGVTTAAGMALVLYIGVAHVSAGTLSLGQLILIVGYLSQLYGPLKTMSRRVASVQSHLASAERALHLLREPDDVWDDPRGRPLQRAKGAVAFEGVGFAYEPGSPVLRDVSFEAPPGSRIALSGRTGVGKTTLLSLLTRFYDPTEGAILLDGIDVRGYRLADLRAQFAIVLQQPVLFSSSVAENIAYARPKASEAEIVAAARAAGAHDFIRQLPEGYDTQVGERGMRLSGGECQRVALARAFLRDAPILILDEPTSAVDVKTEAVILEALERLMHGRTVFLITHRPSTANAWEKDVHLHLEEGRLVEAGSPAGEARA